MESSDLSRHALRYFHPETQQLFEREELLALGNREWQILNGLNEGLRLFEIAERHHVTSKAIWASANFLYQKLDVSNCMQLLAKAKAIGLFNRRTRQI